MMEKVSRLMIWVVNTADFGGQTLPSGSHAALIIRGLVVLKSNDPHCLKAVLNQGRGNILPRMFILPSLSSLCSGIS